MLKNYKENIIIFQLLLICLFASALSCAMDTSGDSGNVKPMELCEITLFKQLMESSHKNDTEKIRSLLDGHSIVPTVTQTSWGCDPLGWAGFHGNTQIARLLLEHGFELVAAQDGHSALHTAAYHKKHEVLRLLLTYPSHIPKKERVLKIKRELWQKLQKLAEYNPSLQLFLTVPESILVYQLSGQDSFDDYVHRLTATHLEHLRVFLAARTEIIAAPMTPYDAAADVGDASCMELLEPRGWEERLSPEILQNYTSALKAVLQDGE